MRDFLTALLTTSATMSVLVLVYIALSPFLEKCCSAKSRYYAWLVLMIGFLIPFRPQFGTAIVEINIPAEAAVVNDDVQVTIDEQDGSWTYSYPPDVFENIYRSAVPVLPPWVITGSIVWVAGIFMSLAYQFGRHFRFVRTIKRWNEALTEGPVHELLVELKAEAGIKKQVDLYCSPCVASPMAFGFFRSVILLPELMYTSDELQYILMHELTHLKRKDLIKRVLTLIAVALHWFNPIAWLMGSAADMMCEISCDGEVMYGSDSDSRLRYLETIIGVVKYQSRIQSAFSTGFYAGKKGMKKRIASILDMDRKRFGAVLVCAALALSIVSSFTLAATIPESATHTVGPYTVYEILQQHETPGRRASVQLNGAEQITMGGAIDIASESISRCVNHFSIMQGIYNMEILSVEADLIRNFPEGVPIDAPPDPYLCFWDVNFFNIDEEVGASFLIHSITGEVWRAKISGMVNSLNYEINPHKAISRFAGRLGYPSFAYMEENTLTTGSTVGNTMSMTLPIDDGLFITANITGTPYYDEDGMVIDSIVRNTLEVYLTTQE